METKDEKSLIIDILDGQTEKFGYFINTYSSLVFSLVLKIVAKKEDAEELTEDTFIKAFGTLNKFQGNSKFSTWIYRIAYNKAISFTRKKKNILFDEIQLDTVSISEADDLLLSNDEELQKAEKIEELQQCISMLNNEDRALIHLFYYQEYDIKEIAEIIDISVSNIKVRLFRVRKKLYIMMKNK
ncbi:MAG: sigma-70 family RNA polymerase sigma factor [Candidatus Paceibacterota bacterium]